MIIAAQGITGWPRPLASLREFLKEELAPYPGRGFLVARMVIATTVVMILSMTFGIPYGAYGAIYALIISRADTQSTVSAVRTIVVAFFFAVADVLIGAMLFAGDPALRLLWVIATLFAMFYALSAMTNYIAAVRFGYLVVITIPLWDEHIPLEFKVENTLWAAWAITIATTITAGIELIFAALKPGDILLQSIDERLASVEELIQCYATNRPVDKKTAAHITKLGLAGTSRLRQILQRSSYSLPYTEQMGAVVLLVGRLVDIAATLSSLDFRTDDEDRSRLLILTESIATIRASLISGKIPRLAGIPEKIDLSSSIPLLPEMERTVQMIPEIFTGSQSPTVHYASLPSSRAPATRLLVPDAFTNPEHVKFGLKGCLAASLCYITYNAVAWPDISTAITTCFLTALTTIGASRQKQILRFTGAAAGGLMGIGAQVFILPSIDSIGGFTLLFMAFTILAAWIATSSTRLSYLGVQLAVAFYLINLQEFKFQTSLEVARDRVLGILLGLVMMWLVFDQLWGSSGATEMRKTLVSILRTLAQLTREPLSKNPRVSVEKSFSLRETINKDFDKVRTLADGVLFEFGESRQQDLALRRRIVENLPQLRMLFLTRIALMKYRWQLPGFELPEPVHLAQQEFDQCLAGTLDAMADRLQGKEHGETERLEDSFVHLDKTVKARDWTDPQGVAASQMQTFLTLSRRIESLAVSLKNEF
jgi:multidrug resistance protein MdtO